MWLQPDENTGDCNILYSVVATTDVLRLQKRQLQTQHVGGLQLCHSVIATLKKV
jgi:hypothetical protein